ncbi:MAG: hypothetical protein JSS55_17105 [Proteobacteria bacterium]|nr:hypothetical protein [Pseudomonadota bacterium]
MTRLWSWAGWIGGILGWVLSDQTGSDLAQADCRLADPGVMLLIGMGGALLALGGGGIAFGYWRTTAEPTRRFIAGTGVLAAAIFLLAIIFQTVSSAIIPQCHA